MIAWVVVGMLVVAFLLMVVAILQMEWRHYQENRNSSRLLREAQKKGPGRGLGGGDT